MYKILFVSALTAELKVVKNEVKKCSHKSLKVDFFEHGMWNYNTILKLTQKLAEDKYDFIINIWVCGHNLENPKKVIQVARSYNIANNKEILYPIMLQSADLESIACSETPVYEYTLLWDNSYVDMESYWFEKVSESFQVARISLKVPVDKVGEETKSFDIVKAKKLLEENINYQEILDKIIWYLDSLPIKHNLEKYLEHYNFTFSEKIIFEKWYFKFISLFIWEKFDDFFNKYSHESKKKFLELLKQKLDTYTI